LITYKDQLEETPNTHPVLTDAAGFVPNIFFSGSAKLVVLDVDDVQYIERDPVGGEKELGDFTYWDSVVTYDRNDIVEGSDGNFYISIASGNQANDPVTSPESWSEIRFLGVWNTNVVYSIGEVVQTDNGDLWKAISSQSGNNPATDDGTNWGISVSLPFTALVSVQVGGGELTTALSNEIQDSSTYTFPLASSVEINTYIDVEKTDLYSAMQPLLQTTGGDLIEYSGGTDTEIKLNQMNMESYRFVSDNVSKWRF
tara:strand:- start:394 stop:1161 length:768 start_codon:yes stop_codon:yes gene_type:complete